MHPPHKSCNKSVSRPGSRSRRSFISGEVEHTIPRSPQQRSITTELKLVPARSNIGNSSLLRSRFLQAAMHAFTTMCKLLSQCPRSPVRAPPHLHLPLAKNAPSCPVPSPQKKNHDQAHSCGVNHRILTKGTVHRVSKRPHHCPWLRLQRPSLPQAGTRSRFHNNMVSVQTVHLQQNTHVKA